MKKQFKKIIATVLVATMMMSIALPAFATDKMIKEDNAIFKHSEAELYLNWERSTDEELFAQGYSANDIKAIRSFDLEKALLERAKLSEEELLIKGYTEDEISALKAYNGETITEESPVLLALADCTADLIQGSYSNTAQRACVRLTWQWDHEPLNAWTDKIVLAWNATRASDSADCYVDPVESRTFACINLYSAATGVLMDTVETDVTTNELDNNVSIDVEMNQSGWWAKDGYLELYLDASEVAVRKIEFCGMYGHIVVDFVSQITFVMNGIKAVFSPALQVINEFEKAGYIDFTVNGYPIIETS